MAKVISRTGRVVAFGLLFTLIVSCGSKINEENFNKIETGMSVEEVAQILGPATESSSVTVGGFSGTASKWIGKEGTITIQFLNEKVWAKQFSHPDK